MNHKCLSKQVHSKSSKLLADFMENLPRIDLYPSCGAIALRICKIKRRLIFPGPWSFAFGNSHPGRSEAIFLSCSDRSQYSPTGKSHQVPKLSRPTWNPNNLYFWGSTLQNKAEIPIKTRVSWVPGILMATPYFYFCPGSWWHSCWENWGKDNRSSAPVRGNFMVSFTLQKQH